MGSVLVYDVPNAQVLPVYPWIQEHVNELSPLVHVPPFMQGSLAHPAASEEEYKCLISKFFKVSPSSNRAKYVFFYDTSLFLKLWWKIRHLLLLFSLLFSSSNRKNLKFIQIDIYFFNLNSSIVHQKEKRDETNQTRIWSCLQTSR